MTATGPTAPQRQEQIDEKMPPSIVILLRSFRFLDEDQLRFAAEQGWQRSFDGKQDPMFFVSVSREHAFVKAGRLVIKLLSIGQPYLGDPGEVSEQLPRPEQRSAWRSHRAWIALDFWNPDFPETDAYAALARLALPLLCEQCCGVFLPEKKIFMPNDGTAEEGLSLLRERRPF